MQHRIFFPFTAIVELDKLKLAIIINAVNPNIGGLLIRGPKGSGKTTAVRALTDVLPEIQVVKDCPFNCNPYDASNMCEKCSATYQKNRKFSIEEREMRVVDLPLGATEDRVVGSLDIEKAIKHGIEALEPGILAEANQNILYVDEVNLLPDHIADDLLDAAATGWNVVEREGISVSHPSRFIFIGTMNPEEGQLRPQLLDRFPLSASVERITSVEERMEVVKRNLEFEEDPEAFREKHKPTQEELKNRIAQARKTLPIVVIPEKLLEAICKTCLDLKVDGLRPDIVISKAATTLTAFENRKEVSLEDVYIASELALSHRTREGGFLEPATPEEIKETLFTAAKAVGFKPEKTEAKTQKEKGGGDKKKKKEGRAIVFIKGDASKKFEKFLEKHKKSTEVRKKLSHLFVKINRLLGQVIFAFGQRMKKQVKGIPSVKAIVKSNKPLKAEDGDEGKQISLKKMKGIPSISHAAKTPRLKKGLALFKIFKGSKIESSVLSKSSFKIKKTRWDTSGFAGKRAEATTTIGRGRASGWKFPHGKPRDIHLPATIRAAARKQKYKKKSLETALDISLHDVREKLRRYKVPMTIIFVLDLSGSMMLSIEAVKKAILKLHGDAYRYRDRVGIVVLKDTGAVVVQHPITNLRVVANKLLGLKISGYTPLAAGMLKAWEALKESKRRAPSTIPAMIVITDGSANVPLVRSLETGEVRSIEEMRIIVREYEDLAIRDVISVSKMIRKEGIHTVVINTNPHMYGRETYGLTVTELIAINTHGKLHTVGRLATEPELVEKIVEKIAEDQRLIAHEASLRKFD
ncbi:MAG: VWA domain-containing protein [Candidatus Bathyarchaeota archaeon]|nr:VWA domain-containing protein [Candidatus Bathyarchaeota archaeon]MDH5494779.1 VWA domain-containing protein [Candidatus Bathyarchaeota archaeon]